MSGTGRIMFPDDKLWVVIAEPYGFRAILGPYRSQSAATRIANKVGYGAYTQKLKTTREFMKEMQQ